jgi:hypothetical protein
MVADQYGSGTRLLDASLNTGGDTKLEQAKRLQTQHSFVVSYPLGVLGALETTSNLRVEP